MVFFEVIKIIGALGLFIYGMMVMSDGIQKLGGQRMRKVLSSITSNRFKGVFTGFSTTALLQSSSVTTLMIVSFVNAGLLSLRQSIGVIMGANIGTTMTAWLLVLFGFSSFSIGAYAFPILALAVPLLFFKREAIKDIGEFLLGFSLLFLGLETMKETVEGLGLAKNDTFLSVIGYLKEQSYIGILLLVIVGATTTAIVQSSSAAMALTLSLCGTMGLPFEMAAALVLGENIGTTITANLGALVGNSDAKRAARVHFLFNIIGVFWVLVLFTPFINGISSIMEYTIWESPLKMASDVSIRYSLSAFHSAFNIVNTILLIGFVNSLERFLAKWPNQKKDTEGVYTFGYMGSSVMSTAEVSLLIAKKEVSKYVGIIEEQNTLINKQINSVNKGEKNILWTKIEVTTESASKVNKELTIYLSKFINKDISDSTSTKVQKLLSVVNDLERICVIYRDIAKTLKHKTKNKIWFTQHQRKNLVKLFTQIQRILQNTHNNVETEWGTITSVQQDSDVNEFFILVNHLKATRNVILKKKEHTIESLEIYSSIIQDCENIGKDLNRIISTILKL